MLAFTGTSSRRQSGESGLRVPLMVVRSRYVRVRRNHRWYRYSLRPNLVPPFILLPLALLMFFALGGGFIAAMSNLNHELVHGANRPLEVLTQPGDYWIGEKGSTNLIEDSEVSVSTLRLLQSEGYEAYGFRRSQRPVQLPDGSTSAIIVDVPAPDLIEGEQGVVADQSVGVSVGDDVIIAGQTFEVTGITRGSSSPAKEGFFLLPENYLQFSSDEDVIFAILVRDAEPFLALGDSISVYTIEKFMELNREYWEKNVGGLTLAVTANTELYTAIVVCMTLLLSFALTARSLLLFRAVGSTVGQVVTTEGLYLLSLCFVSIPLQFGFYRLLVIQFKASSVGYYGAVRPEDVLTGALAMLLLCGLYTLAMWLPVRWRYASGKLAPALRKSAQ